MALDGDRAVGRAPEGTAVSSGESSAAQPQPALGSTPQGAEGSDFDATLPHGAVSPIPAKPIPARPKSDPSNDVTMVEVRPRREPSSGTTQQVFASIGATIFEVGSVLGGRYEIQKLLGMGGMGAVYKAHDLEVDRAVGLKVIRPDLAGNPAILARFKQELVLARQVTHRNIIRIYDLSEAEGVKFITMEFIEGEDLRTILTRQGKLSPAEAIGIISQSCAGLQAAHVEGVIHRDLKPSNIMRDSAGRVVIMDFGLAKTVQSDGMTQTGMMIGTMEYMSPEQAMGSELDARSDIFAMGLIFYELITGNMPYRADSAIASLVRRTRECAVPLVEIDPTVPPAISQIVSKCLEREPQNRYSTIQELLDDLDIAQGRRPRTNPSGVSALRNTAFDNAALAATQGTPSPAMPAPSAVTPKSKALSWKFLVPGIVALLLAGAFGTYYIATGRHAGESAQNSSKAPAMSIAILPYYNASGDPTLNWLSSSLSENLSSDLGQSNRIRLVSPTRLQQVLRDLHISPQSQIDPSQLKRIAEFTTADTVVFGQYEKIGDQIRVNSTIDDLKNDRQYQIATDVASEKDLLAGLSKLADDVRQKLASSPEVLAELKGSKPVVLTKSVPALRAYDEGLALARSGQQQDAAKKFEDAVQQDPEFAMAYSQLAQSYHALGFDDKAEQASRKAVTNDESLPTLQRYQIEASHAVIMNQPEKAIEAYQNITKARPDDTDAQFALAGLYEDAGNYDEARKRLARVRDSDRNNVYVLYASARVELRSDNPQAALEFLNPAYSLATQFQNDEVKASIEQAMGLAYKKLGQPQEALRNFQNALELRKKLDLQKGIANSLDEIAAAQDALGNSDAALASYQEALAVRQKIGDKHGIATNLMNLGSFYNDHAKYEDALKNFNDALTRFRDLGDEASQATCLNNIGTARFGMGNFQDALTYYEQSYQIRDKLKLTAATAASLHNLAETNLKLGQYDTALSQYLKALDISRSAGDQAGIAKESSSIGALYATQGKFGAALASLQDALKIYEQINDRTFLRAEAEGRYGYVLAQVGRGDEGQKSIEDGLKLAADVKNALVTAQALNWLGDTYFYRADYGAARQQYEKAAAVAAKAKSQADATTSKFNLARLDVVQGRAAVALPALQKLVQETDAMGLKAQSVQASLYLAQAAMAVNKVDVAQQELDRAMNRAEKLNLLIEQARGHYLLGEILVKGGRTKEYTPQYREAVRLLESISKEPGAGRILDRADLSEIYQVAAKSYQGSA